MPDEQPDFADIFASLQRGLSGEANKIEKESEVNKKDAFIESLLTQVASLSDEDIHKISVAFSAMVGSLYARRKIRLALMELGFSKSAAKTLSLGALWGAYAIAANVATGLNYTNYFNDQTLYKEFPEDSE